MRKALALTSLLVTFAAVAPAANLVVAPTTTLSAESANNTSASNSMTATGADGQNALPANISKVDVHTLLAPGLSNLPVYAAMQGWWTKSGHISGVGYSSTDPAQVKKQFDDMRSRGFNGMTMAWYGKGDMSDTAFDVWRQVVESSGVTDFKIALRVNSAIIDSTHCPSGDKQACVISQLQYASKYFSSPAYLEYDVVGDGFGWRPVVTFFFTSTESSYCDWSLVRNSVTGSFNPILITRKDKGGFNGQTPNMDGGLAWGVYPDGFTYDTDFDNAAQSYAGKLIWSDASKGFDDQLASWSKSRLTPQRCGGRWLDTWANLNGDFANSPAGTVDGVIVATWNDYEEGTEIESGIDNCVAIQASLSGTLLTWSITGSETTIDHYTIFLSLDGQNLMPLGDWPVGSSQLDLSTLPLDPGVYQFYVKAVGKPVLRNHLSAAVSYSVLAQAPTAVMTLTPTTGQAPLAVTASTAASTDPNGATTLASSVDWGDGSALSSGPTATHTYTRAGSFAVTATVTGKTGLSSSTSSAVKIANQPPVAALALAATSVNVTQTATASAAASTDCDGSVVSTSLNWGDGSTSPGPSASHVYAQPGAYTVTATATDNLGATAQASATVTVNDPPPVAALSLSSVSGIAPLSLTASTSASTSQYSTVASSSINWGDGSTSSGPTASHAYSAAGNYTVTATVTDGFGVSSSVTQLVTVQAPYVLVTSPANGATVASPVPLAAQAFDGRKIASMTVLVDNVSVYTTAASALSASIPMAPGSHAVQVKAYEDVTGAVYQSSLTVNVPALALTASLSLSATSGIAPVAVTATAGGADLNLNGSITAVSIQWGDGSASNGATASHTYATAGKYNVTATVTDNYGITSTATQTVTVQAPYVLITSPVPGATLASPVRVTAQAFDGRPIASMIVYVDSLKAYTIYAGALDAYIPMSSGSHTIKVKAWENVTGKIIESSTTVQVPQPATGVTVIAPTDGATVGSPVRFVASAASKRAIASMAIYVDSLKMYLAYSDWLDTSLAIASGTHRVQVKAWDKGGTLYQQTLYITMP